MGNFILDLVQFVVTQLASIVKIRLIGIRSDRIGHFISDSLEHTYLYNKNQPPNTIDIYYFKHEPVNSYWAQKVEKLLPVRSGITRFFAGLKSLECRVDQLPSTFFQSRDSRGLAYRFDLSTRFTESESSEAKEILESVGITHDRKLILFLLRDDSYLNSWAHERGVNKDFRYHSYRNVDVERYKKSVMWLLEKGYNVLRMGRVASKPLDIDHARFCDYPFSDIKSDFLDIFLFSKADLLFSTGSGLDCLMHYNRRPVVFLDFLPLSLSPTYARCMVLPKTLRRSSDQQILSFNEYLQHSYQKTSDYELQNILIDNLSEDQILEAVRMSNSLFVDGSRPSEESRRINRVAVESLLNRDRDNHLHNSIHPDFHFCDSWLSKVMP